MFNKASPTTSSSQPRRNNSSSGYLEKQSSKFPFQWQTRFFEARVDPVSQTPVLNYYLKKGDDDPKAIILARDIDDVTMEARSGKATRIVLSIYCGKKCVRRKIHLKAKSPEACKKWFNLIRKIMNLAEEREEKRNRRSTVECTADEKESQRMIALGWLDED
mmetsp:Transcript_25809/g.62175  ORF Transcript_25809/g.62175 Transcript_25809/m.62175 type:complete len:162 (-) Transcript_25809:191-676(-)